MYFLKLMDKFSFVGIYVYLHLINKFKDTGWDFYNNAFYCPQIIIYN